MIRIWRGQPVNHSHLADNPASRRHPAMTRRKTGLWLIGARGSVATTTIVGLVGLQNRLVAEQGLVSSLPAFRELDLLDWSDVVVGGHEIRASLLLDEARELASGRQVLDAQLVEVCRADLEEIDRAVQPGCLVNVGPTIMDMAEAESQQRSESPRASIQRLQNDLRTFARDHDLGRIVVVNVASTEPPLDVRQLPADWAGMDQELDDPQRCALPASSLYAIAALQLGYPFINFTPSLGSTPRAIQELAISQNTCHMGQDGKTGETLLKSVLAPMFARRNLGVMSWVGHNIFGNRDGQVLNDPANKQSKVVTKDRVLGETLGYDPQSLVGIEYIESLGDWKTAWDHIHFRGFLGMPMVMQFIWQGCDSLLAAPLVLDLFRFAERAARQGQSGLLTFLASFFKSPLGVSEYGFERQFQMLETWAEETRRN
jgi:myo-inositol-1-phosphate synthase